MPTVRKLCTTLQKRRSDARWPESEEVMQAYGREVKVVGRGSKYRGKTGELRWFNEYTDRVEVRVKIGTHPSPWGGDPYDRFISIHVKPESLELHPEPVNNKE